MPRAYEKIIWFFDFYINIYPLLSVMCNTRMAISALYYHNFYTNWDEFRWNRGLFRILFHHLFYLLILFLYNIGHRIHNVLLLGYISNRWCFRRMRNNEIHLYNLATWYGNSDMLVISPLKTLKFRCSIEWG